MLRRTTPVLAALSALLATTACEDEPDEAVIVTDPMLAEEREQAAAPLGPEDLMEDRRPQADLQPVAGRTEGPPTALGLVPPGVAVLSVDEGCDQTAVFFETDAAALGPEDEQKLERLAACLQGTEEPRPVEITGRADPRGTEPYNDELSRERARAVAEYLNEQGVAEDAFEIRAMGERGVIEGMPVLWSAQRHVMIEPTESGGSEEQAQQPGR